jgi:uncharacterized membrane protein YeiH
MEVAGPIVVVVLAASITWFPHQNLEIPLWLGLVTTLVGALEGAALGRRVNVANVDIVGAAVFALFLGLGGGMVRDIMLGAYPIAALSNAWYLLMVLVALATIMLLGRYVPIDGKVFVALDALTLGLYAAIGTQKALSFKIGPVGAILVGMFASLSGGVIVSILQSRRPKLLQPSIPYGLVGLLGILVYLGVVHWSSGWACVACIAVVVVLRFVVIRFDIKTNPVSKLPAPGEATGESPQSS